MAEDQGVNGDLWNDQATELFKALNWETVGDSNVDLLNEEGSVHGMDRMFKYADFLKNNSYEGVLVEAKRYKTDSFSFSLLDKWIKELDKKLTKIKNSEGFYQTYPSFNGIPLRTGVIMIWFHNTHDYVSYKETFKNALAKIKLYRKNASVNKLYVLENDAILRLASLYISIKEVNSLSQNKIRFYYPSVDSNPVHRSEVLNLNYIFSKFILADFKDNKGIETRIVYYFGKLDTDSFQRLKHALSNYSFLDVEKPLWIYTHQRDENEFRKIKPDIKALFQDQPVELLELEYLTDLPTFMRI